MIALVAATKGPILVEMPGVITPRRSTAQWEFPPASVDCVDRQPAAADRMGKTGLEGRRSPLERTVLHWSEWEELRLIVTLQGPR